MQDFTLNPKFHRFDKRQLGFFILIILLLGQLLGAEENGPLKDFSLKDGENKPMLLSSMKKEEGILVLVFVASTCPVTNLYWDRIKGAWYNYRDRKVGFVAVGGNSDDSVEKIRNIFKDHELEIPIAWDNQHLLARQLGIEFTPEVVVIGKNWDLLYRGRLDDSWRDESKVNQRYLDAALTAALSGQKTPDHLEEGFIGSRLR